MRILVAILLLIICLDAEAQSPNPYTTIAADSVLIYDFEGTGGGSIVVRDSLRKDYWKSVRLQESIIAELNTRLGDTGSFGGEVHRCYDPHLGIIYYKHGQIAGYINICMDCNILRSNIPLQAQMVETIKNNSKTYATSGLSDSFRIFLNGLMIQFQFSHQAEVISPPQD